MHQADTFGRVSAKSQPPSAPKQWRLDVQVNSQNFVRAKLPLTKFKKKKLLREQQYERAGVSPLTSPAPHKMTEGLIKQPIFFTKVRTENLKFRTVL